jgi:NAD(P)-dependent dehydrogenase (short-subunit alcohol dehydrogenase family)
MSTDFPMRDPLDTVMVVVIGVVGACFLAAKLGYGLPAFSLLAVLIIIAYAKAPSRTYPTGMDILGSSSLSGKVVLVTGPTSGIGIETARALAHQGAHVILAARSQTKLDAVKVDIETSLAAKGAKAQLTCLVCDLNDLDSVQKCAEEFIAMKLPLHYLINNAGIMALPERAVTKQNIEQQTGVCHVGHFLLTKLLLPSLQASAPSRIVCLSSSAHRMNAGADLIGNNQLDTVPYQGWVAYGNAKLCNMLHAKELNNRFASKGVHAFSVMPGGIHTGLQGHVNLWIKIKWLVVTPFFFKSVEQGCATTLYAATNAGLEKSDGGKYIENCASTEKLAAAEEVLGSDAAQRCWATTEALLQELGY